MAALEGAHHKGAIPHNSSNDCSAGNNSNDSKPSGANTSIVDAAYKYLNQDRKPHNCVSKEETAARTRAYSHVKTPTQAEKNAGLLAMRALRYLSTRFEFTSQAATDSIKNALPNSRQLTRCIGEGTYGVVFLASNSDSGDFVVKFPASASSGSYYLSLEESHFIQLQKARIPHILSDFKFYKLPSLPQFSPSSPHTEGLESKISFIVTQLAGTPISKAFPNGSISLSLLRSLARTLLEFSSSMIKNGLVHMDLKPPNILAEKINPEGELSTKNTKFTIIDYGEVREKDTTYTPLYSQTRPYRSPRVLLKGPELHSDLFSMCSTLFEIVTGSAMLPYLRLKDKYDMGEPEQLFYLRMHLAQVFNIFGKPDRQFHLKLKEEARRRFFTASRDGGLEFESRKTLKILEFNRALFTLDHLKDKILRAAVFVNKKKEAEHFCDLLFTLADHNAPPSPDQLLSEHPFFLETNE